MAEATSNNQDLFTCEICLDLLKDPVTIPCGHSYCMGCIMDIWDQEDQKGVYSCSQCTETFTPRPVLKKNNISAELVEQIKNTRIQNSLSLSVPAPGDVECDVCTERKLRAVKFCLECLVSYCDTHFKLHNELHPGRKHSVIDATGQIQDRICSQHKKDVEIFCHTDQNCICSLCLMDEHKGHETVTAVAERINKQKKMAKIQGSLKQRIQEREKELEKMCNAVETLKVSRAKELLTRLEQEIAELKRRDAELEQLSQTEDHIYFLKTFHSVTDPLQLKDLSSIAANESLILESDEVKKSLSTLKGQLEDFCNQAVLKITAAGPDEKTILNDPMTREDFLQYSLHFTLDPNTAHRDLRLSEGHTRVERSTCVQQYFDHSERFDQWFQVLCREGVFGRCYWEVEWRGDVEMAVSYKSIRRKGKSFNCLFGWNNQSWSLSLSSSSSSFWHNNKQTNLPLVASSRIGVYVDHRAGTLAFYSISDTVALLHRVQTTFTQPLYPGFSIGAGSSVKLL